MNFDTLPNQSLRPGLERYFAHGTPTGSFLAAVLSNDLRHACMRADDNRHLLPELVRWLYMEAPAGSWGSPEDHAYWCEQGGLNGRRAA